MKVTQKEFDAKRKELSDVQDELQGVRNDRRVFEVQIELTIASLDTIDDKLQKLGLQEHDITSWLEDVWIEEDLSVDLKGVSLERKGPAWSPMIDVRSGSNYENKGYYLSMHYDWKIVTDDANSIVLVPTKKPYKP